MANYNITRSDGTAVTVQEGQLSTTFSLALLGQNSPAYGANVATNTLRHLENFAHTVPPGGTLLTGQLWYNKSDGTMRLYDGANWKRSTSVPVSATPIIGDIVPGTSYYNSVNNNLKIFNGVSFRNAVVPGGVVTAEYAGNITASGNATNYGAKVETVFLTASNAAIIPVVAIKYVSDATSGYTGITPDPEHNNANATVMAVFSERAFSIASTDPYYAELSNSFGGTIVRGLNLRNDYTASFVAQSDNAVSAQSANALFTGTIIPAADFIHVGRGYVPSTTSTFALGSSTNRFSHLFTDTISVGNPVTPQTMNIIGTLTVGNSTSSISQLFVRDVTLSGNISFGTSIHNVGSNTNPISNLFATNVSFTRGTISTTPSANTDIVNKAYVDTVASTASAVATTVTLVSTNTTNADHFPVFVDTATGNENPRTDVDLKYNPGTNTLTAGVFSGSGASLTALNASSISTGTLSQERLANTSITINGTAVALGGIRTLSSTDIGEGTNLYFTAARTRGNISVTDTGGDGSLSYNNTTGVITYTGPSQAEANTRIDARLSGGTGITYTSGVIATSNIPNSSLTNSNITINGTAVALGGTRTLSTTDIAEGTNLYFTAARARGNVSATTVSGISYNSTTGVFSLSSIPNGSLTNTTVSVNGVSIALGGSGNITSTLSTITTTVPTTVGSTQSGHVWYIYGV